MHSLFQNITADHISFYNNVDAAVLRLDKLHPVISGNKWFKLQNYVEDARNQHKKKLVTFGGAWSNHIVATAAACQLNELKSAGIIRGEEPAALSSTLISAIQYGMQLYFVSRDDYRDGAVPPALINDENYLVSEGGYGKEGARGAAGILNYYEKEFTHCCCAVGTGTMMAGLINVISKEQTVIGISALKNRFDLESKVDVLIEEKSHRWQIVHDYHFGGYANYKPALIEFMNRFFMQTNIPSDFVYTGKLFFAIDDLVKNNFFPPGSKLLIIHSGGLQGNDSLSKGTLIY